MGASPSLADRTLPWVGFALLGAALCAWLAYENPRYLLDLGLVSASIFAFGRWPWLGVLGVLVTMAADNQTLELATLVGGGVTILIGGRSSLRNIAGLALLALLIFAAWRLPLTPQFTDDVRPPELYLPFVGVPYLGQPSNAAIAWWRLAFILVMFCLGGWLIRDRVRLRWAAVAIVAGSVYPIADGLRQFAVGELVTRSGSTTRAVEGPFSFPNYFGFYLLGVIVVGLVLLVETRAVRWRLVLGALLAAALTCFVLTYTRSAWIGLAAALAILGVLRYRWLIPVGMVGVILAFVAFPQAVDDVGNRFSDLSSQSPTHSTSSWVWRTGQWKRMIPRGMEHPLAGTGFGSYEREAFEEFGQQTPEYRTVDRSQPETGQKGFTAHNDYVRMLVELGIPGLALWLTVLVSLLGMALRAMRAPGVRSWAAGVAALDAAMIGISFADNAQGYTMDLLIPFVLTAGVATVARRELAAPRPA